MQSPNSWLETIESIEDRVDVLSQSNDTLNRTVAKLLSDRDHHCHTVGQVYQNVTALLTTTQHLSNAQSTLDDTIHARVSKELLSYRSQLLEANSVQFDKLEHQIRRVLENFKDELIGSTHQNAALVRQLTDRVESFHERMVRMEEAQKVLKEEHAAIRQTVNTQVLSKLHYLETDLTVKYESCLKSTTDLSEKLHGEWVPALNEARGDVEELVDHATKHRTEMSTVLQRMARRVQEQTTEIATVKQELKSTHDAVEGKLGGSVQETLTALDRTTQRVHALEGLVSGAQRELTILTRRSDDAATHIAQSTETFKELSRAAEAKLSHSLQDLLKKQESDLDKRHKKLVESVHQALAELTKGQDENGVSAATLATVQQEVQGIRETLHHHSIAIDAQRMEGSLEGAFSEMKDWLQDLERRMVSKSEVEDMVTNVTAQFHQFKQHTLNAEALLGQRLDAERSARENDLSHQSVQFQKLHGALRR
ncbi:Hypothetical protein, putative [Bodo saltans]|uniref:Uncharacterized protein n=1 Tax=Bodo saltans TaxID=75058 RepID=A0A0S4JKN7_BODSA|nr:Hypothetical protein, putative [Bodo saltans]|eukprot:CUG92061.1 Hypothetical protein, putative [Bodo saltans]